MKQEILRGLFHLVKKIRRERFVKPLRGGLLGLETTLIFVQNSSSWPQARQSWPLFLGRAWANFVSPDICRARMQEDPFGFGYQAQIAQPRAMPKVSSIRGIQLPASITKVYQLQHNL